MGGNFQGGLSPDQARQMLPNMFRDARLNPNHAGCTANLAAILFTIGRVPESIPWFERALSLDKTEAGTWINAGMAYKEMGDFDKAHAAIAEGWKLDQKNFYHNLGYSESLLRVGKWHEGWPIYEKARITKFGCKNDAEVPANLPEWRGERAQALLPDGSNPKILVIGEGGIGDRINYCRFLPRLAELGFDYTFYPDFGIGGNPAFNPHPLFDRVKWTHSEIWNPREPKVFSAWTTQFSLPATLDVTPEEVPPFKTKFTANSEFTAVYRNTIAEFKKKQGEKPVIALVWNAGEKFEGDRKFRSLTICQAARLATSCPGIHWINGSGCQGMSPAGERYGYEMQMPFIQVAPWENWEQTAAILAACDGIISVDTGAMHLAGAMGLPMWIILSGNSDWKFGMPTKKNPERTVFYPDARLFRNVGLGFENAIDQIIYELNAGNYPGRQSCPQLLSQSELPHSPMLPCGASSLPPLEPQAQPQ